MSEENNHELDLPLLSNNDEINVYHYVLDLACQLEEKQFEGAITIFCKPGAESEKKSVSIENTQDRGQVKKTLEMSYIVRKTVLGVSEQVRHKSGCTGTNIGQRLGCSD